MASLIIPGDKSITISNKVCCAIKDQFIFIEDIHGSINKSYLFFNTDSIPENALISSAELVLFKSCSDMPVNSLINIYPLKDDFSTCTTYKVQPQIYDSYKKIGEVSINKISVEIDIMDIVIAWLGGTIINKGLVIEGETGVTPLISFGSASISDKYLMPILRIVYNYSSCNGQGQYAYLPVTINYADYENPANYDDKCRLLIAIVVTVGSKKYYASKEYNYIPSQGIDIINVAYVPQGGIMPTIEIGYSYHHL